jgi:hypothetical protein
MICSVAVFVSIQDPVLKMPSTIHFSQNDPNQRMSYASVQEPSSAFGSSAMIDDVARHSLLL